MIKTSEKYWERKVDEAVTTAQGLSIKLYSAWFTGLPDRLNLLPGARINFAEIKTTGQKLKPRQQQVKKLLERLGFTVYIIDNQESFQEFKNAL